MSAFIIKLLKGERPTIYGTGEKRRDFVYVDDVNDFHVICLRDERTNGKTYNIGSGMNFLSLKYWERFQKSWESRQIPSSKRISPARRTWVHRRGERYRAPFCAVGGTGRPGVPD
jgi:UDP-glucose 4-epimerase